jgi:hypothetical protein
MQPLTKISLASLHIPLQTLADTRTLRFRFTVTSRCVMGRLVHTGQSARRLSYHMSSTIPPPPREQVCDRYCSNKHIHGASAAFQRRSPRVHTRYPYPLLGKRASRAPQHTLHRLHSTQRVKVREAAVHRVSGSVHRDSPHALLV